MNSQCLCDKLLAKLHFMKNIFKNITCVSIFLGILLCGLDSFAQNKRPMIPHSHHSDHGGQVLMFGDDHIEVVGSTGSEQIMLYVGDKMREALPLIDVKLSVEVLNGEKVTPLNVITSAKAKNMGLVMIPKDLQKSGVLKIQLIRINPPKGHLSINTPQSLTLNKVFK